MYQRDLCASTLAFCPFCRVLRAPCEDCTKQPRFGVPGEVPKYRWCAGCAQKHTGAVWQPRRPLSQRMSITLHLHDREPYQRLSDFSPSGSWFARKSNPDLVDESVSRGADRSVPRLFLLYLACRARPARRLLGQHYVLELTAARSWAGP